MVRGGRVGRMRKELVGRVIRRVSRRGKRVIVEFEGDRRLVIALGMTGHPHITAVGAPVKTHDHLRLRMAEDRFELRLRDARRFGWMEWLRSDAEFAESMKGLGAEPLDMTLGAFRKAFSRRRQSKALLMDQSVIAGLGNIYCDEALHRSGIHPLRIAGEVEDWRVRKLCRAIKGVLRAAIKSNGSTINSYLDPEGGPGSYQDQHWVYGREGLPCRMCGEAIVRMMAAGRSSHVCLSCQPL